MVFGDRVHEHDFHLAQACRDANDDDQFARAESELGREGRQRLGICDIYRQIERGDAGCEMRVWTRKKKMNRRRNWYHCYRCSRVEGEDYGTRMVVGL
jgi:hypothetical protein